MILLDFKKLHIDLVIEIGVLNRVELALCNRISLIERVSKKDSALSWDLTWIIVVIQKITTNTAMYEREQNWESVISNFDRQKLIISMLIRKVINFVVTSFAIRNWNNYTLHFLSLYRLITIPWKCLNSR